MSLTTAASALQTKLERKLIDMAPATMVMSKLATKTKYSKGDAYSVVFNRLLAADKVTAAWTEGQTSFSPKYFYSNKITATPFEIGDQFEITSLEDILSIIRDEDRLTVLANQIIDTTEYYMLGICAKGGLRTLIDGDATMEVNGTCDGTSSAVALVDDALTQSDDHWGTDASNPGYVTITNKVGPNFNITSPVTDFTASSDTAVVAFSQALTTGSKYHMVRGTNLVATDVLTVAGILRVAAIQMAMKVPKMNDGLYRGIISPGQFADLQGDTTYKDFFKYDRSELIGKFQAYRIFDIEQIVHDQLWREDVDGSENQATGIVNVANYLGKNAFSVLHWLSGDRDFGVQVYVVEDADSGNLGKTKKWLCWKVIYCGLVHNASHSVNLMTGATALPILN